MKIPPKTEKAESSDSEHDFDVSEEDEPTASLAGFVPDLSEFKPCFAGFEPPTITKTRWSYIPGFNAATTEEIEDAREAFVRPQREVFIAYQQREYIRLEHQRLKEREERALDRLSDPEQAEEEGESLPRKACANLGSMFQAALQKGLFPMYEAFRDTFIQHTVDHFKDPTAVTEYLRSKGATSPPRPE
jgi:hypothetical protein